MEASAVPDGMWSHGGGRWGQVLLTRYHVRQHMGPALGKQLQLPDNLGGRAGSPHPGPGLLPCPCGPAPPGSAFGGLLLFLTWLGLGGGGQMSLTRARTWAALAGLAQRRQPAGPLARARHADSRWALALGEVWGSGGVGKDPGTCSWVSQPLAGPSTAQNANTTPGTLRHLTEPHVVTRECHLLSWMGVSGPAGGDLRTGAAGGFPLAGSTQGHRTLCLAWHFPDPGRGSWTPGSLSWGWPGRGQWALSAGGWEL